MAVVCMGGTGDMGGNPSCELCFPSCMGMLILVPFLAFTSIQSCGLSIIFQGDIFPGDHWPPQAGMCYTRQPAASCPPQPHLLLRLTLRHFMPCFWATPAALVACDCATQQKRTFGSPECSDCWEKKVNTGIKECGISAVAF